MKEKLRPYLESNFTFLKIEGYCAFYQCDSDASIIIKGKIYDKTYLITNMKLIDLIIEIKNIKNVL